MRKLFILALFVAFHGVLSAQEGANYDKTWNQAVSYLQGRQRPDGSWGEPGQGNVGITAVVLESLTMAPDSVKNSNPAIGAISEKSAAYLASKQIQEEGKYQGAICDITKYANYCTSLATMALSKYDKTKYAPVIAKAVEWIKAQQCTAATGYDPKKHTTFGGFGYGSSVRSDLSNTWIALEALKAAGVPKDDPVWDNVQIFLKRCQNSTEVNDMDPKFVGDDGGARYHPVHHDSASPAGKTVSADGKTVYLSYGSMSYAMLLSYLWSDVKKEDQPVQLVLGWLEKNFSVERNTNTKSDGQQGLYYYYRVMSKSLKALGQKEFAGKQWAEALAAAIAKRQQKDGHWINPADRWGEGSPELVTGYSLTALATCQQFMSAK